MEYEYRFNQSMGYIANKIMLNDNSNNNSNDSEYAYGIDDGKDNF